MIQVYLTNGTVVEGEICTRLNELAITIAKEDRQKTIFMKHILYINEPLQKDNND